MFKISYRFAALENLDEIAYTARGLGEIFNRISKLQTNEDQTISS
jgi:hypothetical protein